MCIVCNNRFSYKLIQKYFNLAQLHIFIESIIVYFVKVGTSR